jgi:hypothetical protein
MENAADSHVSGINTENHGRDDSGENDGRKDQVIQCGRAHQLGIHFVFRLLFDVDSQEPVVQLCLAGPFCSRNHEMHPSRWFMYFRAKQ